MAGDEVLPQRIGRYLVRGLIGRGSMGAVYEALDPQLERVVAVKVIDPDPRLHRGADDELAGRFIREARLAARIAHPGVVTVHDAGRDGERLFLVMERVAGEPLSELVVGGRRPARATALELVAQAAEALAAAHELGVIHRDVKPSNLLLTADGRLKVTDFGVAKAIGEDTGLTLTGGTVGSPAYMAPEQVKGEAVDGRADLFALGVVLYELLLGRRPFAADTITTLVYQILHHDPLADRAELGRLGEGAASLLADCLAKDPAERVADGRELARRLREVAAAEAEQSAAASAADSTASPTLVLEAAPTATRGGRHRPAWLWGWGALAVVAVTIAVLMLSGGRIRRGTPAATGPPSVPPSPAAGSAAGGPQPRDPPAAAEPTLAIVAAPVGVPRPTAVAPPPTAARVVPTAVPPPTPTPPVAEFLYTRSGISFDVEPEDAVIAIDGEPAGSAARWDGSDAGVYRFREERGVHYVEISAPGHLSRWVRVTVTPVGEDDVVEIEAELLPR